MNDIATKTIDFSLLVQKEAERLARESIEMELLKKDLPLPKESALEIHIKALLDLQPSIRDKATELVKAKQDSYSQSLRSIGIEVDIVRSIELDDY